MKKIHVTLEEVEGMPHDDMAKRLAACYEEVLNRWLFNMEYWQQFSQEELSDLHDKPQDINYVECDEYALEMLRRHVHDECGRCDGRGCGYCLCVDY